MRRGGEPPHVLILGGTEEGYALAAALADRDDLCVTSSLAGATASPRLPRGRYRIGGFGGVAGLRDWLVAERVALLVDASHPFACTISAAAREAAAAAGCRHLRLERPGWRAGPGDRWHHAADLDEALAMLETLGAKRIFAALGARAVPALAAAPLHFILRGIEPPVRLPSNVTWFAGRGPFALADEQALLREAQIDSLLCRNSGGEGARAKLDAARELRLPVVLIERPRGQAGETVPDVTTALTRIEHLTQRSEGARGN